MTRLVAGAITVEPMVAADLPQVMEIERLSFPTPWTPGLFLHELRLSFSKLHVARGDGRVLGYVCWWVIGEDVHILNLAVHPEARRTGLGRSLVQRVLDDAVAQGATTISLEVRRGNAAGAALYGSMGFAESGLRRNYYGPGEDAVIMTRHLRPAAPA